jgi:membrane fusion protein, macrolide-specific efflux system
LVTAPTSGTVANLSAVSGSTVAASAGNSGSGNGNSANSSASSGSSGSSSSSSTSSDSQVLIIGDFSNLLIKAQVNEVDIPKIKSGQKATVTLDAFPDKTFVGTVANVDTIGTTSSGVVTYNVYITLVAPPSDIQPGMSASVSIETDRKDDVLKVPTTAIQNSNGTSSVRVLNNGQINQVEVQTGISSDSETEIDSGLSEGDMVVTSIATPKTSGQSGTSPFSGLGGGRGFGGGGRGGGGGGVIIRGGGGG